MIRTLLVDDHAIVREGFKRLFQGTGRYSVVAEAADAALALEAVRRRRVDVAVIDLSLDGPDAGFFLLRDLMHVAPDVLRVVVSMHDDPGVVLRALDHGAQGYVSKAAAIAELTDVLDRVVAGEIALSSDVRRAIERPRGFGLTQREEETLRGLLSELPPKAIAADLGISVKTLYRHRTSLLVKLGARSVAALPRIARERGLLLSKPER
ncbi:response regulator transcription factor [Lysobacter panacisoli]|uniref:Response regulator transcription factor n=1 Tax=Lysobacter panacisoli TaxID=1255263 RepID=A0ABP9LE69_9GAMM|nr:response regulator transcription factor [Lysobacter panacisoli]